MILTSDEIRALCVGPDVAVPLIETPDVHRFDEDADDIEGGSFDLTLSRVFRIKGPSYTGRATSQTCDHVEQFIDGQELTWKLSPGSWIFQSLESTNIPYNIRGMLDPRTSMFRNGLSVTTGGVHPGFCGKIAIGVNVPICDQSQWPVFEQYCRFASVWFMRLPKPEPRPYHGRWKGSKTTTDGWERAY